MHVETALDAIAAMNPGLRVTMEEGVRGCTLHRLMADDVRVVTVVEPPEGWPVRVIHHHADPGVETEYVCCGDGHDPNKLRKDSVSPETRLTLAEWQALEQQPAHGRIDDGDKLLHLCEALTQSKETVGVLGRVTRMRDRAARLRPPAAPK